MYVCQNADQGKSKKTRLLIFSLLENNNLKYFTKKLWENVATFSQYELSLT